MRSPLWMIITSLGIVCVVLVLLYSFDVHTRVVDLLRWIEARQPWSGLLFILLMTVAVVLLLPGIFFTMGAGFIFGIGMGTFYIVIGTTLGAALSFLIARYCLGEKARSLVFRNSQLHSVTRRMADHDFRVVLLTRLIPFFPGKLSNYFFGLTTFRFSRFVPASAIGFIPFSFHNAYLGSLTADLVTIGFGDTARSPYYWALMVGGLLVTMYFVWFLYKTANAQLAGYDDEPDTAKEAT